MIQAARAPDRHCRRVEARAGPHRGGPRRQAGWREASATLLPLILAVGQAHRRQGPARGRQAREPMGMASPAKEAFSALRDSVRVLAADAAPAAWAGKIVTTNQATTTRPPLPCNRREDIRTPLPGRCRTPCARRLLCLSFYRAAGCSELKIIRITSRQRGTRPCRSLWQPSLE